MLSYDKTWLGDTIQFNTTHYNITPSTDSIHHFLY